MRRINSVGGMNRSHRLSSGAKKVTPPSIPNFTNPRGSGSSFGSDLSYSHEDHHGHGNHGLMSTFSRAPNGESSSSSTTPAFTKLTFEADVIPRSRGSHIPKEKSVTKKCEQQQPDNTMHGPTDDQGIDMNMSPGRDSPGDESSASIATVESVSSGCRNSTTSLDSGRASNSNSNSDSSLPPASVTTFHTIHEHRPMITVPPQQPRLSSLGSSFRQSYHSSTSSLGSMDRAMHEDSICALDINEMLANGVPDQEILLAWLTDLHFEDYYDLFASAGYDMPTITKMTPEDLTAIGVKKPNHRKKLKAEIVKLTFPDGLPNYIPPTLDEFLHLVRLTEYRGLLANQGYLTIDDLVQISIEDLEDIGIYRLGHQKRLVLAIKRAKDLKAGRRIAQYPQTNQNHVVRPHHNSLPPPHPTPPPLSLKQQPQPLQPQNLSSFQPQSLNNSRTNLTKVIEHPKIYDRGLVYQPEVIRIERAPSVSSVVRPPSCSPSPPPPPPVMAEVLFPPMPEPMAPLSTSFQRYHPSFQYPQPPSWLHQNGSSGAATRSYDDVDIALSNRNPERRLMHQHSASNLTASGGTLPRLGKGFTMPNKQRPVAKIIAKTREQQLNPLSDYQDPKMNLQHPLKLSQNGGKTASDSQSINSCGENEVFPFANDNAGTIRMRSNSHVQAMLDSSNDNSAATTPASDDMGTTSTSHHQKMSSSEAANADAASDAASTDGGQRTAGDVLNDIGSMLADLTDELDAMLHMDPRAQANGAKNLENC